MSSTVRLVAVASAALAFVLAGAGVASAHPLGNFTVNHYDGLHLYPDHLADYAVEDVAEIPTVQRQPRIDANGDGLLSEAERHVYATKQCAALAADNNIMVNSRRLTLRVVTASYTERPGVIHLKVGRLVCQLRAPVNLTVRTTLAIDDEWDSAGVGWHEITAVGTGVSLQRSPFPAASVSDTLLRYPNDLLSSPLDVFAGTLSTVPGAGASTYAVVETIPVAGVAARALDRLAKAFNDSVGQKHLTVGVGLLAILLSLALGAGHALLPGHGKTIMAAYLVGRRGRLRDVITVGGTVTITHTAGVLLLGLAISATSAFAPSQVELDLGVGSGLIVTAVGVALLVTAARKKRGESLVDLLAVSSVPPHSHDDGHRPGEAHSHVHDAAHNHGRDHGLPNNRGFSRSGLVGLGVAGGLVPSPSALLVLLAAIALGRTIFGVVLVLGYGLGMAAALSMAGLLLVRLRDRLDRLAVTARMARATRLVTALPFLTAFLVMVVGIGLTMRALGGTV